MAVAYECDLWTSGEPAGAFINEPFFPEATISMSNNTLLAAPGWLG